MRTIKILEILKVIGTPTILLPPVNGKLYIGAQELSKDDRWHQVNYGRQGKKKWRFQEDANRELNPSRNKQENHTHEYIHWVPRKDENIWKGVIVFFRATNFPRNSGFEHRWSTLPPAWTHQMRDGIQRVETDLYHARGIDFNVISYNLNFPLPVED